MMSRKLEPNGKNSLTLNGRKSRRSRYLECSWRKSPTFGLGSLVSKNFQFGNDVKFVFTVWYSVWIHTSYLLYFNWCHSSILTINLLWHHTSLSVLYGHGQPVHVLIPVKSPDTLWWWKIIFIVLLSAVT